jgi:hypothetical protein
MMTRLWDTLTGVYMSDLINLLKEENVRVSVGYTWLVWDKSSWEWVVYYCGYGQKKPTKLIQTEDLSQAIKCLKES